MAKNIISGPILAQIWLSMYLKKKNLWSKLSKMEKLILSLI